MINWFVKNHVAANLLMICIVIGGLISIFNFLPLEVVPATDPKRVQVSVSLRGATPDSIEKSVVVRIEEAILGLKGVKEVISSSAEGQGTVNVFIDNGYDAQEFLTEVKNRVDSISTFPIEAEKPRVTLSEWIPDVIDVAVASIYSEQEMREFSEQVRDDLLAIPGISQVTLDGVRNYEIAINISQSKLSQYGLTIGSVAELISSTNVDVSSGNMRTDAGDILLRSNGIGYRKDDFTDIIVKTNPDGSFVRLKDIANINDGFDDTPVKSRFNGKTAMFIEVNRVGTESAIDVADKVKEYIDSRQDSLPNGYELSYWDDDSQVIKQRLSILATNALQGGFLVLVLLTIFLRPSIALWVSVGIPVSFLGAFLIMPMFGASINILSVFGFILVLGIVVDDAIVTGENVYTRLKTAKSGEEAAIVGTKEIAAPVTFGVLTTMVAFLPLSFIEGERSNLFHQIPIVVLPVLLFSLIESKLVLPAHLKYLKVRSEKVKKNKFEVFQEKLADGIEAGILKYYFPTLRMAINNKYLVVSCLVVTLAVISALSSSGWMKFTFFPRIPSETVRLDLTMPTGTPFHVTNGYIDRIAEQAEELRKKYTNEDTGESVVRNILAYTGGWRALSNIGGVRIELAPPENRPVAVTSQEIVNELRNLVGIIPGTESMSYRAEMGYSSSPIDVQLKSNSLEQLDAASNAVKDYLSSFDEVFDISDSLSDGKDALEITLTQQGISLGLTRLEVSRQVRHAFFGAEAQRIQRGRDDVRVMVRLPYDERKSLDKLNRLPIKIDEGRFVPFSHVASLATGTSPAVIRRVDSYRTVNVTADIDKERVNMIVFQSDITQKVKQIVNNYPGVTFSLEGEAKEQQESIDSLTLALALTLFVIYGLLAIPFKSYYLPFVVMSVIPFGLIGSVLGHWIMAMELTIMSLLGMLALIGVVVNDSLVLVDYINKQREKGMPLLEAVQNSGVARFRPVILTSLTTFIGLMPLLFEQSTQAQFMIPMAVSLGFGILFATIITLYLVPINYLIAERIRGKFITKQPVIADELYS